MDHADHVNLLRKGIESPGGVWADLGAGTGAFTLALADLLGPGAEIYAIDRDSTALQTNGRAMRSMFPATGVHYRTADFTRPLDLPLLDGAVMANSLPSSGSRRRLSREFAATFAHPDACSWSNTTSRGATSRSHTRYRFRSGRTSPATLVSAKRNCWLPARAVF
jgi:predicted RNA methylase